MSMTKEEIQAVVEEKMAASLKNHAILIDEAVDEISDIVNESVENVFWIHVLITVSIFILIVSFHLLSKENPKDTKTDHIQNAEK